MDAQSESVLFVVNEVPNQKGLTRYRHAVELCDSFEATVLCGGTVPSVIRDEAATVRTYPESALSGVPFAFPLWLFYWTVRSSTDTTVVSPHSLYILITSLATALSGSVHVVDLWDDLTLPIASYATQGGPVNRIKRLYHQTLFELARRCLSRTDLLVLSIHPGIVEKYALSTVPIVELTNGYNSKLLSMDAPVHDTGPTRFVYLGRANAKRGIDVLVRQLAENVPSARLDVIGSTDEAVDSVAAQYDTVTLYGERPYDEALGLVARADVGICVLDTSVENYQYSYPIKLFEYAALGKAIVASDTPAIRSILTDGESALLVDSHDDDEFRDAVTTLAADGTQRRRLGENARAEIRQYAWPEILEQYTAAIRSVQRGDEPLSPRH